jgi:ComF family protein
MQTREVASRLVSAFWDLLLPRDCPGCGEILRLDPVESRGFCELCWQTVIPITDPCGRCGVPGAAPLCPACRACPQPFASVRATWLYGGQLAVAIHRLKYRGAAHLARPLGALMAAGHAACPDGSSTVIVPVPLHPARLRRRGFNQAALLAREAVRAMGAGHVRYDLLHRIRDTAPLAGLGRAQRLHNVEGAFAARPEVRGRTVLLVDDVMTTGATAAACARAALEQGARQVHVLTLARAVP